MASMHCQSTITLTPPPLGQTTGNDGYMRGTAGVMRTLPLKLVTCSERYFCASSTELWELFSWRWRESMELWICKNKVLISRFHIAFSTTTNNLARHRLNAYIFLHFPARQQTWKRGNAHPSPQLLNFVFEVSLGEKTTLIRGVKGWSNDFHREIQPDFACD